MKKIVAIALTLVMLCGAVTVLADTGLITPSKTTEDLVTFGVEPEKAVEGKTVTMSAIDKNTTDAAEKAALELLEKELEKAAAAKTVEDYFGKDAAEAIAKILGAKAEISLDEAVTVKLADYVEENGLITITAKFPTPYDEDEKVAVMVGLPEGDSAVWSAFEGVGLKDGSVKFAVDAETALAIEAGYALMYVLSAK